MSYVRELVDPAGTLPDVELSLLQAQTWTNESREKMAIVRDGVDIGKCTIYSEIYEGDPIAHFDGIEIDEELRGRQLGLGLSAYVLAIELSHSRGNHFETQNYELTAHSKKIWELLISRGAATVIQPFTPAERFEDRFVGRARVPLPE